MWFRVVTSIMGTPAQEIRAIRGDLLEELQDRTYLRSPRVMLDTESGDLATHIEVEASDSEQAEGFAYDEIFESVIAVLEDFETVRVDVLDIESLTA